MSRINRFFYRLTRGRLGGWVPGAPVVLLTTTGRRTGLPRTVPLAAVTVDGDVVVGTGAAGSRTDPQWFLNLVARPQAIVESKGERFDVLADVLDSDEH